MARPGDACFLWALSAHWGVPACQAPGCPSLGPVSHTRAQIHTGTHVGWELSRLFDWSKSWLPNVKVRQKQAKDPMRQNNQQNAKPTNSEKFPNDLRLGSRLKAMVMFVPRQGTTASGHCAQPGTLVFPGMLLPTSVEWNWMFPAGGKLGVCVLGGGAPIRTGRPHDAQREQWALPFLIVSEQYMKRFSRYNTSVISMLRARGIFRTTFKSYRCKSEKLKYRKIWSRK